MKNIRGKLLAESVVYLILLEFFTQCATINAEISGGFGLIVIAVLQYGSEHWLLNLRDDGFE
ncbi:MAG: hypothetical protein V3R76_08200 [Gammaproteobacteria bacterium]